MADTTSLIQMIVSGVVSGGAGATASVLTFFREMRGRIEKLEKALGNPGSTVEPRTGIYLLLAQLVEQLKQVEDAFRKFKRDVDSWEDDPPEWFTRALNRRTSAGSLNVEHLDEFEQRVEGRVKLAIDRLKRLEEAFAESQDQVSKLSDEFEREASTKFVDIETYEQESKKRADEIRRIQENLHTANGFLRGVMAALGYLDPPPSSSPLGLSTLPRKK